MVSSGNAARSLESIRHDLEELDRAIVLLVAARLEAAGSAIRLRGEQGEPISNPAQEDRVVARAQGWAEQVGLSPTAIETIFRAIVGAGKERYAARDGPSARPADLRGGGSEGARRPRCRNARSRRLRKPLRRRLRTRGFDLPKALRKNGSLR